MNKRITYLDYLRVAATIAVVLIHVASFHWLDFDGRTFYWNVLNFFLVMVRWAVPIFVMLSGSLFLSKDLDIKRLYKKNISRMAVAFFAWSAFYALALFLGRWLVYEELNLSFGSFVLDILDGYYHMWFIPMIIGLYMCAPVIRQVVINRKVTKYFLQLAFLFAFVFPQAVRLCHDFIDGPFLDVVDLINSTVSYEMKMSLVLGYTAYFVLGHLLAETELTKKQRNIIYILGAVGFATSICLNAIVSWKTNEPYGDYFEPFCVNTLFVVIAVHTWFKYKDYSNEKLNRIVAALAKYSFGAYLVHAFVLDILGLLGLNGMIVFPVIAIPLVTLIAAALSYGISWVIHKIPVLNKWIV